MVSLLNKYKKLVIRSKLDYTYFEKENSKMDHKEDLIHDHDHEHEHEHDTVTLTLENGEEMACPIIDIFTIEKQDYIALLHPVEHTALLYRFHDYEDGTIDINAIESDDEFDKVAAYMNETFNED